MNDIDKLEPGRKLDALVAEEVLNYEIPGWTTAIFVEGEYSIHPDTEPGGWACFAEKAPVYLRHCLCKGEPENDPMVEVFGHATACLGVVRPHSTDIAAAWEVVEKYRGEWITAVTCEDNTLWSCYINSVREGHYDTNGSWAKRLGEAWSDQSAPHAICLAALKAVRNNTV